MDVISSLAIVIIIGFMSILLPIIANIIQNGQILDDDKLLSIQNKFKNQLESIEPSDLQKMTKKAVFELFQILPPVDKDLLNKTYRAENLPQAVLSPFIQIITDKFFGPGKWIGKGFKIIDGFMEGYNIFQLSSGKKQVGRPFRVRIETSEIDNRPVTKLDYKEMNRDIIAGTLRDELRMVNSKLFLGMGISNWGLGPKNPAHFVLYLED